MPLPDDAPRPSPAKTASRSISWKISMGTLAAALLAGAAAWPVCEAFHEYFQPSEEAASQAYDFRQLNIEEAQTNSWNGAIVFGTLGGLLGMALGLAGGVTARSTRRAITGGLVGLVLGGLAGALPPFVIMPWHWMNKGDDPATLSLARPLMIHAGLWCGLGLAAGLAYGVGRFGGERLTLVEAALGGLIGAAIGTFVYEMAGAMLFPLGRTADPIAAVPMARLLALLCVSGFIALGILLALRPSRERKPKAMMEPA